MQLYEYFKPGLTQIVLATGKPTCPRLVPFNPLLPYPFSNPYFVFLWSRLSFSFSPSLCRTRFPRRRFFLVFSFIASVNSSLSLSLSSASLTLSPSFRVAYPSLSPPASRLPVSSPLFSVALERLRSIDSFPGNMKERVRRT